MFQDFVWHTDPAPPGFDDREWQVMVDLAFDLDYYVADPGTRREDPSFYGDERLVHEIRESISSLSIA